jgi:tight adherence protein B
MDVRLLIISLGVFLAFVAAIIGVSVIAKEQAKRRLRDRLNDVIMDRGEELGDIAPVVLRDMDLSTVPLLNTFLKNAEWAHKLDTLLVQADLKVRLGNFILIMVFLAALGAAAMIVVFAQPILSVPVGIALGSAPLIYAKQKKIKRLRKFEQQFPDALDMLTNALRAGMALTGAIQVVAEESPAPVATEFAILFEENRLGLDLKEALHKLAGRVDSAELHLFVTAVIIQRETGGNLAEILQGTAAIIRDRFRILGDVRSMTAQARLSGTVLALLPLALAGFIIFVAPDYLKGMLDDPVGPYIIGFAVFLQIAGYLIMRRIVDIKV